MVNTQTQNCLLKDLTTSWWKSQIFLQLS